MEAARRMTAACDCPQPDRVKLVAAARLNWRLWTIFQSELSDASSPVPVELRRNMLNLCNFVDKRIVQILADPRPELFAVLVNINRQVAAGLLAQVASPADGSDGSTPDAGGALSV